MKSLSWSTVALVLLFGTQAAADALVVTSGRITLTDEPGLVALAGSDFDLFFGWFPPGGWGSPCIRGCAVGTVENMATTYNLAGFQGFGGTVNGVSYPRLFREGALTFDGPVFAAPGSNAQPLVFPFAFHGNIALFTDEAHSAPPVFSNTLVGGGTVNLLGFVDQASRTFFLEDAVYTFAPTPEPSSVVLLLSGVAAAAGITRRARRATR